GRFFTEEEERGSTRVIVLGSEAAKDLFAEEDPIGQRVKIGSSPFQVIGVMKERGA
ncbi:MAG: ABC transporter permease, partial [Candidatus Harrisonbacteria bacterium CG10_big_fil_rev_8_21_14_0_10_44_23]